MYNNTVGESIIFIVDKYQTTEIGADLAKRSWSAETKEDSGG